MGQLGCTLSCHGIWSRPASACKSCKTVCYMHAVDPACLRRNRASSNRAVYKGPQKASCGPEFNNLSIYLFTNTCCFPMEVLYISVYIYTNRYIYSHIYTLASHCILGFFAPLHIQVGLRNPLQNSYYPRPYKSYKP